MDTDEIAELIATDLKEVFAVLADGQQVSKRALVHAVLGFAGGLGVEAGLSESEIIEAVKLGRVSGLAALRAAEH